MVRPGQICDPLSDDEVARVLGAHRADTFTANPFSHHRREALMTAGLAWGMTQMHLTRLTAKQMDIRNDMVQVGRCQVPYTAEIKEVMQRWLVVRAGYVQPYIDALFITISGQPANSQVLRSVIDELREKSGVDVSLKRLRDTYGVTLIGNNMPPEQVTQFWTRPDFNLTSGVVPLKTDAVSPLPCLDRCPELHRRLEDTHALEHNVYPVLDI